MIIIICISSLFDCWWSCKNL